MSNSFPSMICNEPPPLDQTDDEDEDSSDFRDFASGLKLDVDPSPMSTPRKAGNASTPPLMSVDKDKPSSEQVSDDVGIKTVLSAAAPTSADSVVQTNKQDVLLNSNVASSSVMKTSYIGTMQDDPEVVASETPCYEEEFSNFTRSELVTQPCDMQVQTDSNASNTDDESDFDDFQDFQTTATTEVEPHANSNGDDKCENELMELGRDDNVVDAEVTDVDRKELYPTEELSREDANVSSIIETDLPTIGSHNDEIFEDAYSTPTPIVQDVIAQQLVKEGFQVDFGAFDDDDEFDNFQDFKSSGVQELPELSSKQASYNTESQQNENQAQTFGEHAVGSTNFEPVSQPSNSTTASISFPPVTPPEPCPTDRQKDSSSNFQSFSDDEDFDDFQAFQSTPSSLPSTSTSQPENASGAPVVNQIPESALGLPQTFENLVKSLFISSPSDACAATTTAFCPIDKQLKEQEGNEQWNRVEDFEASQGLLFKWLNSVAYQKFLQSLKIDNSAIIYTDKWGAIEVPRFAASLVDTPLLPETKPSTNGLPVSKDVSPVRYIGGEQSSSDHESANGTVVVDSIPVPILATGTKTSNKTNVGSLSCEAEQILSQLPDLSYMRAKNVVFPSTTTSHVISSDV